MSEFGELWKHEKRPSMRCIINLGWVTRLRCSWLSLGLQLGKQISYNHCIFRMTVQLQQMRTFSSFKDASLMQTPNNIMFNCEKKGTISSFQKTQKTFKGTKISGLTMFRCTQHIYTLQTSLSWRLVTVFVAFCKISVMLESAVTDCDWFKLFRLTKKSSRSNTMWSAMNCCCDLETVR